MFYMLRPELHLRAGKALCSDAYTGFVMPDPNRSQLNRGMYLSIFLYLSIYLSIYLPIPISNYLRVLS